MSPSKSIPVYWAIKQCPMLSGDVLLVDWYVSSHHFTYVLYVCMYVWDSHSCFMQQLRMNSFSDGIECLCMHVHVHMWDGRSCFMYQL